jgi:hypothetical protein
MLARARVCLTRHGIPNSINMWPHISLLTFFHGSAALATLVSDFILFFRLKYEFCKDKIQTTPNEIIQGCLSSYSYVGVKALQYIFMSCAYPHGQRRRNQKNADLPAKLELIVATLMEVKNDRAKNNENTTKFIQELGEMRRELVRLREEVIHSNNASRSV